ncbi:MAG: hypothetical protein ABII88_08250 [Candidatus Omnitrophota bacterium]
MKNLLITAIILIVISTGNITQAAELNTDTNNSVIPFFAQSLEAVYCSVALHELGHYTEAQQISIAPRIKLGFIRSKAKNGSSSYYLGKTSYEKYPDKPQVRAKLALAGLESSGFTYETLNQKVKDGQINDRFSSMLALVCKNDFPSYALLHKLKQTPDPSNDIENYIQNSGADKNFVYTAAVLDILFNIREIAFHTKRIFGHSAEFPEEKELLGFRTKPTVFVKRNMGIAIGVNLKKTW